MLPLVSITSTIANGDSELIKGVIEKSEMDLLSSDTVNESASRFSTGKPWGSKTEKFTFTFGKALLSTEINCKSTGMACAIVDEFGTENKTDSKMIVIRDNENFFMSPPKSSSVVKGKE
jgi:hypothetical protein